ncbi:MAG: MBL fold metallo-hydrolase [Deltaproteobacteria bacterium]|nr:MBL fold metallo-hydrolase [Deltaproteobacteria bacterium]
MNAVEIMKDLFFIERGYLNSNHFVYRSEQPVLIDTGYIADFDVTERLIEDIGVKLAQTRLIINTHTHCDHIGGNRIIQGRSGCDIALNKVGKNFMDTHDDWATWWRYFSQEADFFNCTEVLDDEEVILIGPHEFQVIYTPGHASDGIVLYNRKAKVLISGDALWEDDIPTITMRVEGSTCLFDLSDSLEKLESLDVEIVYPGHGRPFTDFKEAIYKSKRKARDFLNHKEKTGAFLLKKIMIFTILMHRQVDEEKFFDHLMGSYWFKETIDLFFNNEYQQKYEEVMSDFLRRDIVRHKDGKLFTTVKP